MAITAHTMEYRGGPLHSGLSLENYDSRGYEEYRRIYEDCFYEMRSALGLCPACCAGKEVLQKRSSQIFLLREQGALAGSVAIYGHEIDDLIVARPFQGKGYGKQLLQFAVFRLQSAGISPILLHVAGWNRRALSLYQKCGFTIIQTETISG